MRSCVEQNEKAQVMELTTSWKEEGIAEGMAKGLSQGLAEGLEKGLEKGLSQGLERGRREASHTLLLRLMRRRWGTIPPAVVSEVEALSFPAMEELAEAFVDFNSLSELQEWLAKH
jgi:flagellar biosynthesis/type III secretory pathway protein FliH